MTRPLRLDAPPSRLFIGALCVALWAAPAQSQNSTPADPPADDQAAAPTLPAPVLLGQRTMALKQRMRVRPALVLVKNEAEFAEAVAAWDMPRDTWPVLIDDGGDLTRENIARFVRAFKPRAVVRWTPAPGGAGSEPWPADKAARAERITKAYRSAWEAGDDTELLKAFKDERHTATGLVLANASDPAWTAALTIAAGRGQRLAFIDAPRGEVGDMLAPDQVAALLLATEEAARATGQTWDETGDDLDALTLCTNTPSKFMSVASGGVQQIMAFTDRLARKPSGERWGWAGQIFGDAPTAAYRAMCSVFLGVESAWAFDGYAVGSVPGQYNLKPINDILTGTPYRVAFDPARTGAQQFRRATAAGIDAGLIFINTKGTMWNWELSPGRMYSFDVPMLNIPSVVHFTHSYSAQVVHHRSSVAGRWLENGAYAYFGSVDEPFLNAFVMGPDFFQRFFVYGGTFPSSARYEVRPVWKLNYFGDPVIIAGAPPLRRDDEPLDANGPLAGMATLEAQVRADLKEGRIESAAAALVMLGRDKDAARLCLAAARTSGAEAGSTRKVSERIGAIGAPAAFRERDPIGMVTLMSTMPPNLQADPFYVSLMWQGARPLLERNTPIEVVRLLKNNIRELCAKEDLLELTPAVSNLEGRDAVEAMWRGVIRRTTDPGTKQEMEAELRSILRR